MKTILQLNEENHHLYIDISSLNHQIKKIKNLNIINFKLWFFFMPLNMSSKKYISSWIKIENQVFKNSLDQNQSFIGITKKNEFDSRVDFQFIRLKNLFKLTFLNFKLKFKKIQEASRIKRKLLNNSVSFIFNSIMLFEIFHRSLKILRLKT
jgi:hypothetical protein